MSPRGALRLYGIAALVLHGRRGPVLCPLRLLTRRPCPFCGLTRATGHALRGDLRASVHAHPLGVVVAAALAADLAALALGARGPVAR